MTRKSLEPQSSASETCGVSEKVPNNMEQMMRKMLACCGPTMAERMQDPSPGEREHAPGDKTGQPPQDVTRGMAGCGCAPMMGECCKGGTSKASEQD
jgi:hypothetical protein